jgi:hypothetical protein
VIAATDLDGDGVTDYVLCDYSLGDSGPAVVALRRGGTLSEVRTLADDCGNAAVGDFNRDGRPDVAVTGTGRLTIAYGGVGFITSVAYATGPNQNQFQVFTGDFDGDRVDDAAILETVDVDNQAVSVISILYGTVQGTPDPPVPVAEVPVVQIETGILPSDELDDTADLIVNLDGSIAVLQGRPYHALAGDAPLPAGDVPVGVVTGGPGLPLGLVATTPTGLAVQGLPFGVGPLTPITTSSLPVTFPSCATSDRCVVVAQAMGTTCMLDQARQLICGTLDGVDLRGTLTQLPAAGPFSLTPLHMADVDANGHVDVVTIVDSVDIAIAYDVDGPGPIRVETFTPFDTPVDAIPVNSNRDEALEILVVGANGATFAFPGPDGTYALDPAKEGIALLMFDNPTGAAIADIDGDGVDDLLIGDQQGVHVLHGQQGSTSSAPPVTPPPPPTPP